MAASSRGHEGLLEDTGGKHPPPISDVLPPKLPVLGSEGLGSHLAHIQDLLASTALPRL